MHRRLLKSKIHRATITAADLHYDGSLTLAADLMAAADLVEFEQIDVVNVNNGARLTTYVITGPAGTGTVQLNGAAARHGMPGDLVIIMSFTDVDDADVAAFTPAEVHVDGNNRLIARPTGGPRTEQ